MRVLTASTALQDIRVIAKADPNENERKRLRSVVLRQHDAFKQAHAHNVANQTLALQNEQLKLQRQVATDMRIFLESANMSPAPRLLRTLERLVWFRRMLIQTPSGGGFRAQK